MPQNMKQEFFFTVLMVPFMVIFMIPYNNLLAFGSFAAIPIDGMMREFFLMGSIAAIVEVPVIAPLAQKLAFKIINPRTCKPLLIPLTISFCTVCIMCPFMSLMANTVLHNNIAHIWTIWPRMAAINYPAALGWQLLVAGPTVRALFKKFMTYEKLHSVLA